MWIEMIPKRGYYSKMKWLSCIFFVVSLLQVTISTLSLSSSTTLPDFMSYYDYSGKYLNGINPYPSFNHPPASLPFFALIHLFPFQLSQTLFTLLSLALILLSSYLLMRRLIPNPAVQLFILGILLQLFPTKLTLGSGQINHYVLFFLVLSFLLDLSNKNIASGLILAFASALKIIPLALLLYFLARKRYITVLTTLIAFFLLNGAVKTQINLSPLSLPSNNTSTFFQSDNAASIYDQSLRAFLTRLNSPLTFAIGGSLIITLLLYIGTIEQFKSKKAPDSYLKKLTLFSTILAITVMGNAYAWQHHYVYLYPALIAFSGYAYRLKRLWVWLIVILVSILIGFHFPDVDRLPSQNPFVLSHTLLGGLILVGVLLYLPHNEKSHPRTFPEI